MKIKRQLSLTRKEIQLRKLKCSDSCSQPDALCSKYSFFWVFNQNVFSLSRANLVIQCENWWNLAKQFARRSPPLHYLSSSVQRTLMKALVLGGFAHMDTEMKQQYWTEVSYFGASVTFILTSCTIQAWRWFLGILTWCNLSSFRIFRFWTSVTDKIFFSDSLNIRNFTAPWSCQNYLNHQYLNRNGQEVLGGFMKSSVTQWIVKVKSFPQICAISSLSLSLVMVMNYSFIYSHWVKLMRRNKEAWSAFLCPGSINAEIFNARKIGRWNVARERYVSSEVWKAPIFREKFTFISKVIVSLHSFCKALELTGEKNL